jgi:hypothetical protein
MRLRFWTAARPGVGRSRDLLLSEACLIGPTLATFIAALVGRYHISRAWIRDNEAEGALLTPTSSRRISRGNGPHGAAGEQPTVTVQPPSPAMSRVKPCRLAIAATRLSPRPVPGTLARLGSER